MIQCSGYKHHKRQQPALQRAVVTAMCWASITEKSLGRSMLPSSHAHDHSTFSASSCCWTSPLVYEAAMTLRKSNAFSICRYLGEMSSMTRRRKNAYASAPVSQVLRWYHRGHPQGYLRGLHQKRFLPSKKTFRGSPLSSPPRASWHWPDLPRLPPRPGASAVQVGVRALFLGPWRPPVLRGSCCRV